MSYPENLKKSRIVVSTPQVEKEVSRRETVVSRDPGISTGLVTAIVFAAIILTAVVVWALARKPDDSTLHAASQTTSTTAPQNPAPPQQPVVVQQPAPAAPQQPIVVQQPPTAPSAPTIVVPPAPATAPRSPSDVSSSQKAGVPDDVTVQDAVDKALQADSSLSKAGVIASVLDRKATLTGTVETEALKQRAERLVRNVKGVKSVDNQLAVIGKTDE